MSRITVAFSGGQHLSLCSRSLIPSKVIPEKTIASGYEVDRNFVQRENQVTGLIHLLSLALRLLTIIEFVVRQKLQVQDKTLTGLYPDHPKKPTDRPTTERLLRTFSHLTLTIIEVQGKRFGYVPPLNPLQQ